MIQHEPQIFDSSVQIFDLHYTKHTWRISISNCIHIPCILRIFTTLFQPMLWGFSLFFFAEGAHCQRVHNDTGISGNHHIYRKEAQKWLALRLHYRFIKHTQCPHTANPFIRFLSSLGSNFGFHILLGWFPNWDNLSFPAALLTKWKLISRAS